MKLPNFGEFIEALDPDAVATMLDAQNDGALPLHLVQFRADDPNALPLILHEYAEQLRLQAQKIALVYLELYHQWLRSFD